MATSATGLKRMMFDFSCQNGHTHEDLVYSTVTELPCPTCNEKATRLVATPRFDPRLGCDSGFPTMAKKWERTQRQRQRQVEHLRREHGDTR